MSKMATLLKKQALINAQIEAEKMKAREEVVYNVREAIAEYGITLREIKNVLVLRKPRASKLAMRAVRKTTAKKATAKKTATGRKRGRPAKK
jgi:predicted XRE-type DNA-binding protein